MLATSAAEARRRAGAARAARRARGALGFAAELAGVATGRPFGHYAYSARLGPRVRGVPLLAAAAWAMMARPAWVVARRSARGARARVPLAAGALTAWDVFLDPRMVRERLLDLARRRTLRGRPGARTSRAGCVTGLGGVRAPGRALDADGRADGRRRARALRVDLGRRGVRQRRALGAPARRRGRRRWRWARSPCPRSSRRRAAMRVAVVGAGVGGLAAAFALARAGHARHGARAARRARRQVRARRPRRLHAGTPARRC